MTHMQQVELALAELERKGITGKQAVPAFYRLAWRLGIKLPPPLFQRFLGIASVFGIVWGVQFGVLMLLFKFLVLRETFNVTPRYAVTLFAASAFFGLSMAAVVCWKRRALNLPDWASYAHCSEEK